MDQPTDTPNDLELERVLREIEALPLKLAEPDYPEEDTHFVRCRVCKRWQPIGWEHFPGSAECLAEGTRAQRMTRW
jgi:hypothetical protein